MSDEQKKLLESQLWAIANILRGKISANQFQDYILGFIFYKYLSEKLEKKANNFLKPDGILFHEIDENSTNGKAILEALKEATVDALGYFLKPSELFTNLAKKGNAKVINEDDEEQVQSTFILEDLANVLNNIEKSTMGSESQDDFDNLFYDIDLNSTKIGRTTKDRNDVIVKILTALDGIDFDLDNTEGDVLGDAYEYLIGQFAAGAGQKAGEFYTPQQVSTILAKIVTTRKSKLKTVYDPTCGSGSLLLRVAREVQEVGHFYGQEQNRTTYNLARMNMILHDVNYHKFDIKNEDTLERPQHIDFKFEAIVANPPFSAKWSANPLFSNDDRFSQYGRLAPGTKADFAFIQHMVHQLDDNGIMACIAPHGVLFRGAAEGHIRKFLIEDRNYIDAIIGLPANLFYGTSIPTCILVLKKCKETPENILFIDASNDFEKVKNQNVLRDIDIDKIIKTYQNRKVIDKYSNTATLEEVKANDYNLNISKYVNTLEKAVHIDLNLICSLLKQNNSKGIEVDKKIQNYCNELNLPFPEGHNLSGLILYKKGIMQNIFNQEIRFKDDNGNDFEDWNEKSLGEVGEIITGKTPSTADSELWNGDIQFITPTDIKDGTKYQEKTVRYVTKNAKLKVLPVNSIIYTCIASIGKMCISKYPSITNQQINSLVINQLNSFEYVYYWLYYITPFVKSTQANTTLPIINKTDFSKFLIQLPCIAEQNKIANFLSTIDEKIELVSNQIQDTLEYQNVLL